mgnify:CR=1 FL=1
MATCRQIHIVSLPYSKTRPGLDAHITKRTAILLLLDIVATYAAYWLASLLTDVEGEVFVNNEIYFMLGILALINVAVLGLFHLYNNLWEYASVDEAIQIVLAVVLQLFLNRTRPGLNLRSVGENPATADAAGINVTKYKYLATCVGAGISGLGGLYYTMDYIKGTWANDGTIESLGWLAVALVIFATWRTVNAIWGSYLFGLLFWVYLIIPGLGRRDTYLFNMLPYLVTIAVLIFVSLRNKKENQPPASLGLAYFREER